MNCYCKHSNSRHNHGLDDVALQGGKMNDEYGFFRLLLLLNTAHAACGQGVF